MSSAIWDATNQKEIPISGLVNINDSVVSEDSTFSSKKINDSLGELEKNYGKKEIADCNTVEETISYIEPNTLHSPKAEGLTNNARGILISAIREAPDDYCVQTAILNGSSQHFTRCKLPNNDWQPWVELATMDKVENKIERKDNPTEVDLNKLLITGRYSIGSTAYQNIPTQSVGVLIVENAQTYTTQMYIAENETYIRLNKGNGWLGWQKLSQ